MRTVTTDEFQKRMEHISKLPPVELDGEERKSLKEAMAMNDGTTVTLEELEKELEDYSGRLVVRIPRSLHKELKEQAAIEGVSLNQYMVYKLAR